MQVERGLFLECLWDTTALRVLGGEVAQSVYIGFPPGSWTTGDVHRVIARSQRM